MTEEKIILTNITCPKCGKKYLEKHLFVQEIVSQIITYFCRDGCGVFYHPEIQHNIDEKIIKIYGCIVNPDYKDLFTGTLEENFIKGFILDEKNTPIYSEKFLLETIKY